MAKRVRVYFTNNQSATVSDVTHIFIKSGMLGVKNMYGETYFFSFRNMNFYVTEVDDA